MNILPMAKKVLILNLLVEGNSMRAVSRIADVSINTVTKVLVTVGKACVAYQDKTLRRLTCKKIQMDEIWSFCGMRDRKSGLPHERKSGFGDVWTYVAIDPDTKLVPCWYSGKRTAANTRIFIKDLASRLANRVQFTSDGWFAYQEALFDRYRGGIDADYGMLFKSYETKRTRTGEALVGEFKEAKPIRIFGEPIMAEVSTSIIERQNLTMRCSMKRFARKTNAHSKKIDNHVLALALHFMYYNFGRIHQGLRVTPAMEAGVSDHVWSLEEIAGLV